MTVGSKKKPPPSPALPPAVISMCFCCGARCTKPATRSRCSALISGPISTPVAVCRPVLIVLTALERSATSRSYTFAPA